MSSTWLQARLQVVEGEQARLRLQRQGVAALAVGTIAGELL